jgi:hypothetical protein
VGSSVHSVLFLRVWGQVLSRRSSWLCGAGIHWTLVERGIGEPVREHQSSRVGRAQSVSIEGKTVIASCAHIRFLIE